MCQQYAARIYTEREDLMYLERNLRNIQDLHKENGKTPVCPICRTQKMTNKWKDNKILRAIPIKILTGFVSASR